MLRKYTKKCPDCGSIDVLPILYGFPGEKMREDAFEGKILLGGCVITENHPDRHCNSCEYDWNKKTKY